jgi:predicted RNase H-like nuclease (RuvC/YqgF family)
MSRANKALVVMVVAVMGLWGCAQENKKHGNADPRVRALEIKNARLEEDFHAVVATRDALRRKLAALDQESARLGKELEQLQSVVKERDELRTQVTARATERDTLQTQLEGLRSGIRTLLGQADKASAPTQAQPLSVSKIQPEEKS